MEGWPIGPSLPKTLEKATRPHGRNKSIEAHVSTLQLVRRGVSVPPLLFDQATGGGARVVSGDVGAGGGRDVFPGGCGGGQAAGEEGGAAAPLRRGCRLAPHRRTLLPRLPASV